MCPIFQCLLQKVSLLSGSQEFQIKHIFFRQPKTNNIETCVEIREVEEGKEILLLAFGWQHLARKILKNLVTGLKSTSIEQLFMSKLLPTNSIYDSLQLKEYSDKYR